MKLEETSLQNELATTKESDGTGDDLADKYDWKNMDQRYYL